MFTKEQKATQLRAIEALKGFEELPELIFVESLGDERDDTEPVMYKHKTEPFYWDFSTFSDKNADHCGSTGCALGAFKTMGIVRSLDIKEVSEDLGISQQAVDRIFYSDYIYDKYWECITPEDVLNKLYRAIIIEDAGGIFND